MIVWGILLGFLAGLLDGSFVPAIHWPPLFSFFCVALIFFRPHAGSLAIWTLVIISGLWLDLAWMVPVGVFIIWHAVIYAVAAGLGRYLTSLASWGGSMVLLFLVSFVYFLGLAGWEMILGRGRDIGLWDAILGALATLAGAWLGRAGWRRAGRLSRKWFFIRAG